MGHLHLTALELENFKSFKGEVTIPLEEGFTGITGPNGSGKSNCGDAVQFVLGTRSSKSLRAKNIGELIFNGGNRGKAARHCKATLVFANPKGEGGVRRLQVDTDEVRLTRSIKLGRKGNVNSSYYLNERPSTATEIRRLLSGAGARGDGYNIVLQGDVTELAIMTAGQRRKVLEDVAGVTAYDDEIRKAGRQQDKVEQYLEQIAILEDEITSRLKTLSKERGQAMKYRELKEALDNSRQTLMQARHRSRFEEIELVSDERSGYIERLETIGKEVQLGAKQELAIEDELADIQRQLNEVLGDDGKRLADQQRRLEVEVETRKDRIIDFEKDIKESEAESEVLASERDDAQTALNNHEESLESARTAVGEADEKLQAAADAEEEARTALDSGDKATHEANRAFGKATDTVEKAQLDANSAHLEAEGARQSVDLLHEQLAELEVALDEARLSRDDLLLQGEDLEEGAPETDRTSLAEQLARLQRQERGLLEDVERTDAQLRTAEMNLLRARGELETRSGSRGGMAQAVKAVMTLRERGEVGGILGSVGELCAPKDPRHEEALAWSMGGGMNSIVVRDDETAAKCIAWLRKNDAGRATFLPLNKLQSRRPAGKAVMVSREAGVVGLAIDLLDFDPSIEAAVRNVVRDTLIVEAMDIARRHMGGVRMVTLNGGVVEASGAMVGGSSKGRRMQFGGKIAGTATVDKAEQEVERMSLVSETTTAALAELRRNEHALRQRIANLSNDDHALQVRAWKDDLKRAETAFTAAESKVKSGNSKVEQAKRAQSKSEEKSESAASSHEQSVEDRGIAAETLQAASPARLSSLLRDSERQRNEAERTRLNAEGILSGGENQSQLLTSQVADYARRYGEQVGIIEKAKARIIEMEGEIETYQEELDIVIEAHSQVTEEHKELDDQRITLTEDRATLRARLEQKSRERDTTRKRIDDLNLQIEQKRRSLEELTEEMQSLEIAPPKGDETLPTVKDIDAIVRTLERKVNNLGDVNMHAIEQYDEAMERSGNLTEDAKKLRERRSQLLGLAEQLEDERTARFTTVLNIVNENFSRVYKHLQPGGAGELRMENPKKPFEGGLEMWARPPGKKSGLGLLSGGEKSMAALALIFAIQDYEPSPFYYFDEVDQNLDTFNAENIASLCRLRSKQAQFIMVTLRKVSLQLADHHIGVTHAGDGCSRLITDFDREQALEVGDAAHEELKAIKATEEKKKELEGLPKTADMARAPEEVEAPTSLGGIDLGEPVEPVEADELELDAETELAESDLPLTEVAAEVAAELELDAESDLPLAEGDTESEVEFTEDTSLISLADRAEDFKEDMDDKLSVALPIEQEQRDELDARDAEETEEDAEAGEVEIEVPSEDEVE